MGQDRAALPTEIVTFRPQAYPDAQTTNEYLPYPNELAQGGGQPGFCSYHKGGILIAASQEGIRV